MATAQLASNVDEEILRRVTAVAVEQGTDVQALFLHVLEVLSTQPLDTRNDLDFPENGKVVTPEVFLSIDSLTS